MLDNVTVFYCFCNNRENDSQKSASQKRENWLFQGFDDKYTLRSFCVTYFEFQNNSRILLSRVLLIKTKEIII